MGGRGDRCWPWGMSSWVITGVMYTSCVADTISCILLLRFAFLNYHSHNFSAHVSSLQAVWWSHCLVDLVPRQQCSAFVRQNARQGAGGLGNGKIGLV